MPISPYPPSGDLTGPCDPAVPRRAVDSDRPRQPQRHVRHPPNACNPGARADYIPATPLHLGNHEGPRLDVRTRLPPTICRWSRTEATGSRPITIGRAADSDIGISDALVLHGTDYLPGDDAGGRTDPGMRTVSTAHSSMASATKEKTLQMRRWTSSQSARAFHFGTSGGSLVHRTSARSHHRRARGTRRRPDYPGRRRDACWTDCR